MKFYQNQNWKRHWNVEFDFKVNEVLVKKDYLL